MSNKTFFIILPIVIILSLSINHKIYGNSNSTNSGIEIFNYWQHERAKTKYAKGLADYMYGRIKYYQGFDKWWERAYAIDYMYEVLQKMDIK